MSDYAIRYHQVHKQLAGMTVLRGVDLAIRPGELFGLVGVNGAGKTTLLKCLFDFCTPDAGSIAIFGQPHHQSAARQPLSFLPERFQAPYFLTGRDFLRYLLSLHRVQYDDTAVRHGMAALDLAPEVLGRPARDYSKGMMQKLGLLACLLSGKRQLVLDEPMSGLDPKARALFKQALLDMRTQGRGALLTSHALADVEELCDRMAILHEGRIVFTGTPLECRHRHGGGPQASLELAFLNCIATENIAVQHPAYP
ncbi:MULTISPECIES: ABC transporter ATP-binding protein [unclassified Janthinobacterium]|uniref:ABC transporter ATP-binding protein n=1 Tax=unclassified Janthinobacterium TaxID=2610881 RepID=UPI001618BA19|nr:MULTISPECIES: ABC transporter ATP-binding protein [unclassified Janthinobacterium]MBB5609552.1 ABC-2 type transport system ATP-binding protein [Janthinobacterium sp. S3T4]MBB5614601.1 ABC-2 type transport system ATP-binding protein [Janthinobacterium sp. S3M3]